MSSLGLKKLKRFKSTSYSTNNEININILNDDCFIQIFELLSQDDRLKAEMVCKRWERVGKLAWSNVKILTINRIIKNGLEILPRKAQTNYFINLIERCGAYLNEVCIRNDLEANDTVILKMIVKHCKNLNKFSLIDPFFKPAHRKFYIEEDVTELFEENAKLSSIFLKSFEENKSSSVSLKSLSFLKMMDCLFSLTLQNITDLSFESIQLLGSVEYFCKFFKKLINLKKFHVEIKCNQSKNILIALNQNKYQDFEDLAISFDYNVREVDSILLNFIFKHENLCKLSIENVQVTTNYFSRFNLESIQELKISFLENIPSCIGNLKNLTSLDCKIENLTDESIKILGNNCLNLEHLKLTYCLICLTEEGKNNFVLFQKLESFKLYSLNLGYDDSIVKLISGCESLKELHVLSCQFTHAGVKNICLFTNLISLNVSNSNFSNNQLFLIVKKLENLKYLNISNCRFLTRVLFKIINELKNSRGDKNILTVYVDMDSCFTKTLIEHKEELKSLSLLYVTYIND